METVAAAGSPITVLTGGMDLSVTKRDGGSEVVTVLDLAIEVLPRLAEALDNELEQIAIYCGKDAGWAKSLSKASQEKVILKGEEVNGAFFGRWLERRMRRIEQLQPGVMQKVVLDAAKASASPSIAQRPRSERV